MELKKVLRLVVKVKGFLEGEEESKYLFDLIY